MKIVLVFILAISGGILGSYLFEHKDVLFGATTARTTITNQWTFSATTTMSKPLIITTSNSATSTLNVGCVQLTATSTASPIRLVFGNSPTASTTYTGTNAVGTVFWQYGYCPNLP